MNNWEIKVLYLGKITLPKAGITPGFDPDLIIAIPYLGFLLKKGERKVLVDSGIKSNYIINGKAWGGYAAEGGQEYLLAALDKEGVKPGEIDTVIYTHLHNDHAAYCSFFQNARIVVQKDEWLNLLDPLPAQNIRGDYDPSLIPELRSMKHLLKIDGDVELPGGIKLYKTPGHSAGSQSIGVETKDGLKIIVGDHLHMNCMAFPEQKELMDMDGKIHKITPAPAVYGPTIPSSLIYDYYSYYDSTAKLKAYAPKWEPGFIICGHEPSLMVTGA